VHFRKQAEDARRAADESRRGAEQVKATDGVPQADRLAREGAALLQRQEFAVATQKFLESRDGFDRARRAAEAAARAVAARPAAVPATLPTAVARAGPAVPPVAGPPLTAPAATVAAPTLPATAAAAPTEDPGIRRVITDYGRAIETSDIALFKAVKPNLTADEQKRLQESFKATKSHQVGIKIDAVQVDGAQATVKITRQDTINGTAIRPIQQTFRLVQTGGGWAIQTIGQ
jgi:hypothetical protein